MARIPAVGISSSRRSRKFGKHERLWQDDLDRLLKMIAEHVKNLEAYHDRPEKADSESAPNLSLAIFGPAGSGKSSFLKTLVEEAKRHKDDNQRIADLRKVSSLDILQPARFGEGDHLLFATIAAGLDAHRRHGKDHGYDVLTEVLRRYRDLAGDLRVIREEPPISDQEPHALAAEVIQRHTSGLSLGRKIDQFIDALADDLNSGGAQDNRSSVVLLPVDDLDLNPRHLLPGLREVQAYLLHPRLIPVFCFTDRLAEEILAGEFAKIVTHADKSRKQTGRLSVSEQLAVQYLSKCFPIRNRLRLGPIPATLQGGDLDTDRPGEDNGTEPVLWTLITASVVLFGVPDRSARHPVRSSLRPSTLRRQFHVIDAMRQAKVETLARKSIISLLRPPIGPANDSRHFDKRIPDATWGVLYDRAAWALMNVHRDVLREFGMHLEDLYSWAPHGLRRVLLDSLFQQPAQRQISLWQRWRSLSDSRRSQVVSLLAANAFRPWLDGERPSGEDLPQIAMARDEKTHQGSRWCQCEHQCEKEKGGEQEQRCKKEHQTLDAPVALQWFLDLVVGFYLPFSRSVYRHLRAAKEGAKEPLSGAGWSFHSAPIHAAEAAHDDQKLFPSGMMFLDPFSYATALTTAPRIAACRVLDEAVVPDGEAWELIKNAKIFFLSARTKHVFKSAGAETNDPLYEETQRQLDRLRAKARRVALTKELKDALIAFEHTANWEAGKTMSPHQHGDQPPEAIEEWPELGPIAEYLKDEKLKFIKGNGTDLEKTLKEHDYTAAGKVVDAWLAHEVEDDAKEGVKKKLHSIIRGLKATANAVHDDQLLMRIWTCYGYNRGRFWAAVSLWRGLGLMGHLIETHRRWQLEYLGSQHKKGKLGKPLSLIDLEDRKALKGNDDYERRIREKIEWVLHTHSLRGLVPGKDLGELTHRGTLELAFSGWNTEGQRRAVHRLAERLQSWLDHNWGLSVTPLQEGSRSTWGQCFIRRLHGGYMAGSLWQWLDAEFLEHQGHQYGQRRSYYWNAGVALTSWLRVLQRYFKGSHEIRWLIETCPLTAPFLSRSAQDPFLAKLREKSYEEVLALVAKDGEKEVADGATETESRWRRMREPSRFRAMTEKLQELWKPGHNLSLVQQLVPGAPAESPIGRALKRLQESQQRDSRDRVDMKLVLKRIAGLELDATKSAAETLEIDQTSLNKLLQLIRRARDLMDSADEEREQELLDEVLSLITDHQKKEMILAFLCTGDKSWKALTEVIRALKKLSKATAGSLTREDWHILAEAITDQLTSRGEPWSAIFSSIESGDPRGDVNRPQESGDKAYGRIEDISLDVFEAILTENEDQAAYKTRLLENFRPRREKKNPGSNQDHDTPNNGDTQDKIDPTSACFEIASMIQQFWKMTAHASAASLFYQIPRVRRIDFFDHDGPEDDKTYELKIKEPVTMSNRLSGDLNVQTKGRGAINLRGSVKIKDSGEGSAVKPKRNH